MGSTIYLGLGKSSPGCSTVHGWSSGSDSNWWGEKKDTMFQNKHLGHFRLVYKAFYKEKHVSTPITFVFQPVLARCFELSGSQWYTNPALTALLKEVLVTAGLTKICHLFTTVGWMSAKNLAARLSITSVHLAQRLLTGLWRQYVRLQVFTADPQR